MSTTPLCLIKRLLAVVLISQSVVYADTILIDFGNTNPSPTTGSVIWNNMISSAVNAKLTSLNDTAGVSTGISLTITDGFVGTNTGGSSSTTTGYASTATSDSFYGIKADSTFSGIYEADGDSTIVFSNLTAGTYYTFTFYASRTLSSDNRETQYDLTGMTSQSLTLNAANNVNNTVTSTGIQADATGNITLTVHAGANNTNSSGFYYLGLMEINAASGVPEPAAASILFGAAATGLVLLRRKKM